MAALTSPVDVQAAATPRLGSMHPLTEAQAMATGRKFEAMFMSQMMQEMFAGVSTKGWFGGGDGEQMFRPMLIEQYGKLIANHGNGMGIATAVAHTLLQAQEARQ